MAKVKSKEVVKVLKNAVKKPKPLAATMQTGALVDLDFQKIY